MTRQTQIKIQILNNLAPKESWPNIKIFHTHLAIFKNFTYFSLGFFTPFAKELFELFYSINLQSNFYDD